MKGPVRSAKGFQVNKSGSGLVALWLLCALANKHFVGTSSGEKETPQVDEYEQMELRRSTARYEQYMLHRDSTNRELLQVEVEKSQEEKSEEKPEEEKSEEEKSEEEKSEEEKSEDLEALIFANPYHLGATIKDWDEQRTSWLYRHSRTASTVQEKPSVLLITGSQPLPCRHPGGDHFHLKALKNKIDYARIHGFEIFYNFLFLDPQFVGVWAKLPVVRTLMITHPEIEWFIWMDADAIFTDMLFEIPFHKYDDYNLVIWTWMDGFYNKDWVSVNDGVFLLRNCQWSLDLFDKWSPMGHAEKTRDIAGKFLSSFLTNRRNDFPADDQSALMYVMLKDEDKSVMDKVKLIEKEYKLHGYWVDIVGRFEEIMKKYHPGLGDCRWPLVTHFTGCSPCSGFNNPDYPLQMCMDNFNRAFNFADNQVLAYMGYQHKTLESIELVRIWNETSQPLRYVGVNPWKEREAEVAAAALPIDCF